MAKTTTKTSTKAKPAAQAEPTSPEMRRAWGTMATSGTICGAAVIESFQSNLMG